MRIPQSTAHATQYPVGLVFDVSFKEFSVRLSVLSENRIRIHIAKGSFAKTEEVTFKATLIRPGLFLVSWVESSRATVVHVEDFAQGTLYSHATVPDGTFLRMAGALRVVSTATETGTI